MDYRKAKRSPVVLAGNYRYHNNILRYIYPYLYLYIHTHISMQNLCLYLKFSSSERI